MHQGVTACICASMCVCVCACICGPCGKYTSKASIQTQLKFDFLNKKIVNNLLITEYIVYHLKNVTIIFSHLYWMFCNSLMPKRHCHYYGPSSSNTGSIGFWNKYLNFLQRPTSIFPIFQEQCHIIIQSRCTSGMSSGSNGWFSW